MSGPAAELSSTYRYDEIDRFLLFAEQLEVACELLGAETLAKTRTALVVLDNLANLLFHRHAEAVFAGGEGSHWYRRKRYTRSERREIFQDFNRMLRLAGEDSDGPPWRAVSAILTEPDAVVMRVAHGHRNGVYHEDRHNAALIQPLSMLYAQALGRAFVRSHARGWSYSIDAERAGALSRLGYESRPDDFAVRGRMLDFAEAAQTITGRLTGRIVVHEQALSEHLAGDVVERTVRCAQSVLDLLERSMPAERLEWVFFWSQFWDRYGADERWLALQEERDALAEALPPSVGGRPSERDRAAVLAYRQAEEAYIARAHELQRDFKAAVTWGDAPRLGRLGERLADAKDVPSLLSRYEQIDRDVKQLEIATAKAAVTWDQMVESEVDRAREGD